MILAKLNQPEFEYDIHSLIKAFFPEENVSATAEDKKYEEEITFQFQVEYEPQQIKIEWKGKNQESHDRSFPVDFSDRTETKNELKQNFYQILSEITGKKLPWGTLTGIRPTKIPMKFLEEGKTEAEIRAYMRSFASLAFFARASDEKIDLSIDIAERELEILKKIDYENGYSLYIGIPFCPTTCLYCSFTSYPLVSWRQKVDSYLDALEKELDYVAVKFGKKHLNSIYIGGGTPTTLEPYQLDRLIRKIRCSFDLSHCLEFTVEAGRPDSITREKLETLKKEKLKIIGRRHTVAQTVESFQLARELGFDDINMDLIMGLPEESLEDVRDTLEQVKALKPDNLTVHSLALKRAARLNMFKEDYKDYKMVNTTEHMNLTAEYAKKMGLEPYYLYRQKSMAGNLENVGYASPGKAGIYNILIMEEKQTIVACGAGASTKRVWNEPNPDGTHRIERCENVKDVGQYIERIDEMIERKQKLFAEE